MNFKSLLLLILTLHSTLPGAIISNKGDCGWLGDQLINYIKAKYIAHKYKIPFRLKPFQNSGYLMLGRVEPKLTTKNLIGIKDEMQINPQSRANYDISYYCQIEDWTVRPNIYNMHTVLQDEHFIDSLRQLIRPIHVPNLFSYQDDITVAVHVRKVLKTDKASVASLQLYDYTALDYSTRQLYSLDHLGTHVLPGVPKPDQYTNFDWYTPFKFVPDQFYIDQIIKLCSELSEKNILVYIFTNDPNPGGLVAKYKELINMPNITYKYTQNFNNEIFNDLYLMSQFDYLIRGGSNFSQIPDLLGKHKKVISPQNFAWYKNNEGKNCLVVETVYIKERNGQRCSYSIEMNHKLKPQ